MSDTHFGSSHSSCLGGCGSEAADEIERLSAIVAAVDALHHADDYGNWCCGCEWMWPCPTHLAIHPDSTRRPTEIQHLDLEDKETHR